MSLAGDIGEIAFADLAQLCAQTKCTGSLVLSSTETGQILGSFSFENGELFDARMGRAEGVEAVYRAVALQRGVFRVDHNLRSSERRVFVPLGALLLEAMRRIDEGHHREGGSMKNLETKRGGPRALSAIPPRQWKPWVALGLVLLGAAAVVGTVLNVRNRRLAHHERAPTPASAEALVVPVAVAPREVAVPAVGGTKAAGAPAGVTDTDVLFGMVAPLTGPAKELGRQMKIGLEAAFAEVNDAGGVHGRRLRLTVVDDGYEPTRTAEAMKELCDQRRVFGIVGNVGTPTAAVALPIALEHKMLFYGAFTGANLLRQDPPDRYVFNFRASYIEETAAVVRYLVRVRHVRPEQIAVFAQQDAFGDAGYAGVTKAMRALRPGMKAVLRVGYKRNTLDIGDAVAHLRERPEAGPVRAVVMVATYRAAAKFIEKVRDTHPNMIFTNVSFVGSTALAEELNLLGPRYATGVIVTQVVPPVDSFSTAILKYKAALGKYAPGEKLDYVSLEGYWAAEVLVEGLRRTGAKLDTERLVDALENVHDLDLGIGTRISFGLAEHQGSHKVWGTELNAAGRYQAIDLE